MRTVLLSALVSSLLSAAVATLTVAVLSPPTAEAQTRDVSGRAFRLVDGEGRTRAALAFTASARQPSLWLYDQDGKTRVLLDVDGLTLLDGAGRIRAMLSMDRNGGPSLAFSNEAERVEVTLNLNRGALSLHGSGGKVDITAGEGPYLTTGPIPQLVLTDGDGKVVFLAP